MRLWLHLPLMVLLIGCGDQGEAPPRAPSAPAAPAEPFHLEIDAPGLPGRPAPIRIEGDATGVTVRISRAAAPLQFFESWFVPVSPLTPPPRWEDAVVVRLDGPAEPKWPVLAAGLHLVTATRGGERRIGLLPVTDLDLVIRRSDDEVVVFVVDSRTGTAMPDARVSIIGPRERRTGRADSRGVFRAAVSPGPEMRAIAFSGERIGVGNSSRILGREDADLASLLTDRKTCAPGCTVTFAGVVRVRSEGRIRPYANGDGRYEVLAADGRVLSAGAVEPGPAGTFRSAFYLPKQVRDGPLTLRVEFGHRALTEDLKVRRPFPAPVTVQVLADGNEPEEGSRFRFRVRALLADGTPLAGAVVKYAASRGGRPVLTGEGVIPDTGDFSSSLMLDGDGEYDVSAEVTGPDLQVRSGSLRFGVHTHVAGLKLVPKSRLLDPGETAAIRIIAEGGGPVTGTLRVDEEAHSFRIEAEERETLVRFLPAGPGRHPLEVTAKDRNGRELRAAEEIRVLDGSPFATQDTIALVADRDEVRAGEPVRLLLLVPPELSGCSILETIEGRSLGLHRAATHFKPQSILRFVAPHGIGPEVRFRVSGARHGRLHAAEAVVHIPESQESLHLELVEERRGSSPAGIVARVTEEGGLRSAAMVLFSATAAGGEPGLTGSLSPWLRTGREGRTEAWQPPADRPLTIRALAVSLDGRVARQTLALSVPPGAGNNSAVEPPPVSPPASTWNDVEQVESVEVDLPTGSTERWITLPAEEDLPTIDFRVRLTATRRSRLLPAFERLSELPAGTTIRHLLPLLRLAAASAFGEEWPGIATEEAAADRSLADLLHQRRADGSWGHFPGDAPDPQLTDLVRRTIGVTGLRSGEFPPEDKPFPPPGSERPRALDAALECYDLLREIPAGPPGEPRESLVRVRVNNMIVGTTRLVHGKPDREYRSLPVPSRHLRPGNNLVQFDVAGQPGITATVTIAGPRTAAPGGSPLSLHRGFLPDGSVSRGARITARVRATATRTLRRVLIRCPVPSGAKLATWPTLPEGVFCEERDGGIDLFVRELDGTLTVDLPLVVLRAGTFAVPPAGAMLLEDPGTWAQSEEDTLRFR